MYVIPFVGMEFEMCIKDSVGTCLMAVDIFLVNVKMNVHSNGTSVIGQSDISLQNGFQCLVILVSRWKQELHPAGTERSQAVVKDNTLFAPSTLNTGTAKTEEKNGSLLNGSKQYAVLQCNLITELKCWSFQDFLL